MKVDKEIISTLRRKLAEAEAEVRRLDQHLRTSENALAVAQSKIGGCEAAVTSMYEAVRVLADRVEDVIHKDKKARHEARRLVEEAGLKPPANLGSSRKVGGGRRGRRKRLTSETGNRIPGATPGQSMV